MRKRKPVRLFLLFALAAAVPLYVLNQAHVEAQEVKTEATAAAIRALDDFMEAFNSRDPEAWAATLNYPHVRFASGGVSVWETPEEFAASMDFGAFAQRFGWDHSEWDYRNVMQASANKVHVEVKFTRYDIDGNALASHESFYIVTERDGHWGTQARSSFAP